MNDGGWGWIGRHAKAETTSDAIGGTDDDVLYQSQREGVVTYQFDDAPAGTYAVDLGFAEHKKNDRPDMRLFDVSVNGDYVLVRHDVVAEVGSRYADDHQIVVEHSGGPLTVEFHDRRGYQPPIVNAIKVTERPDL